MIKRKLYSRHGSVSLPCFYCSADSTELKAFLILVIGGLVFCSVLVFIGLHLKGMFSNTEELRDSPLKAENIED